MKTRRTLIAATALAFAASAGLGQAFAAPAKHKPKPLKGTWSFTDTTPDPSGNANGSNDQHCDGKLPAGPADVNAQTFKVKGKGSFSVTSHVVGDWAIQLKDAKGNTITGDDVNPPDSEALAGVILKKGTYSVVLCNLEGAPTATADYTFTYR
jgi:hypothetical protein